MVLSFAHTLGEFGVVLMVGGNLPGVTRTVSISIYDNVQALDYQAASHTAFFLLRRHRNVYLDISGIPPKTLLKYFPRLEEIAAKTLFGTDWPGPGVPDIKQNLDDFRSLKLPAPVQEHPSSTRPGSSAPSPRRVRA